MAAYSYDDLRPGIYMIGTKKKLVSKPTFRHGTRWTDEETKICADFTKTDEQVAAELCRTVVAVTQRRNMIRFCQRSRKAVRGTT